MPKRSLQPEISSGEVLEKLRSLSRPEALAGMKRFAMNADKNLGVSLPEMRKLAKEIGRDHRRALELWELGWRETRIVASLTADPGRADSGLLERWVAEFSDWEVCDQVCQNLFILSPFAVEKALAWSSRPEEFVKRAGFAIMAWLAFKHKSLPDSVFGEFLGAVRRESQDGRNFVKKAVNWALRQIGKRNPRLHGMAIAVAEEISRYESRAARWIAADALKELESRAVRDRLKIVHN